MNKLPVRRYELCQITDALGFADYFLSGRGVGNIVYGLNSSPVRANFSSYGSPDLIECGDKYTLAGESCALKLSSDTQMSEKSILLLESYG